jgi:hypothetical protein
MTLSALTNVTLARQVAELGAMSTFPAHISDGGEAAAQCSPYRPA